MSRCNALRIAADAYGARIIESMMTYSKKEDLRMVIARDIAFQQYQTYNGKGYPRLKSNGIIFKSIGDDYTDCQNNDPLSGSGIPIEALIVGVADRINDVLRSSGPYKEACSYEKALPILAKDSRTNIAVAEW